MGLLDRKDSGLLLPEEEWGKRELRSRVGRVPLAVVGSLVPVSAALMLVGDGRTLTWIGLGLYLVFLAGFTALNLRAIR